MEMMSCVKYKKKEIKLDNSLTFLKYFRNEESFSFYNPLKKEFILGARRLRSFSNEESMKGYLYVFSSMTFFDSIKDEKWAGIGNENIAFKYYLVEKDGQQTFYYLEDFFQIENVAVELSNHKIQNEDHDYSEWQQLFTAANNSIHRDEINKVVISREVKIQCDTNINFYSVLQKLLNQNKESFVFSYSKDGKTFLGATPEILVQKEKDNILSYALAGTSFRNEKEDEFKRAALLSDNKNRYEHKVVIDSIVGVINKFADEVVVDETKIMSLKNLHHLQTCIHAKNKSVSLLQWIKLLHPTPALGGYPVNEAIKFIKNNEKHDRGLYGAPIGIIDENGDGVFVVGIRSALIEEKIAYSYVGCGIVKDSNCETEYIETKNKLKTIIESF